MASTDARRRWALAPTLKANNKLLLIAGQAARVLKPFCSRYSSRAGMFLPLSNQCIFSPQHNSNTSMQPCQTVYYDKRDAAKEVGCSGIGIVPHTQRVKESHSNRRPTRPPTKQAPLRTTPVVSASVPLVSPPGPTSVPHAPLSPSSGPPAPLARPARLAALPMTQTSGPRLWGTWTSVGA